jgi:hypothetical protein
VVLVAVEAPVPSVGVAAVARCPEACRLTDPVCRVYRHRSNSVGPSLTPLRSKSFLPTAIPASRQARCGLLRPVPYALFFENNTQNYSHDLQKSPLMISSQHPCSLVAKLVAKDEGFVSDCCNTEPPQNPGDVSESQNLRLLRRTASADATVASMIQMALGDTTVGSTPRSASRSECSRPSRSRWTRNVVKPARPPLASSEQADFPSSR